VHLLRFRVRATPQLAAPAEKLLTVLVSKVDDDLLRDRKIFGQANANLRQRPSTQEGRQIFSERTPKRWLDVSGTRQYQCTAPGADARLRPEDAGSFGKRSPLAQNSLDDLACYYGRPLCTAVVHKGDAQMVQAKRPEHRGVNIVDVRPALDRVHAEFVG